MATGKSGNNRRKYREVKFLKSGEEMKTNDYVKFMTEQIVTYMDSPTEEKKQKKREKQEEKELFASKWFGVLPLALKVFREKNKKKFIPR